MKLTPQQLHFWYAARFIFLLMAELIKCRLTQLLFVDGLKNGQDSFLIKCTLKTFRYFFTFLAFVCPGKFVLFVAQRGWSLRIWFIYLKRWLQVCGVFNHYPIVACSVYSRIYPALIVVAWPFDLFGRQRPISCFLPRKNHASPKLRCPLMKQPLRMLLVVMVRILTKNSHHPDYRKN